jgi:putative membrane protein
MIKNITTENRYIGLLVLCYFFEIVGISFEEFKPFFLHLSTLNLLLTLFIFYKINNDFSKRFLILSSLIFVIGYSVEVIGVATGLLFGNYSYGNLFGFKVFETPLLIGINWLFLSLSTHGIVQFFTQKPLMLVTISALLMTGLDFFIEPVAMKLEFWTWDYHLIPIQNFLMWFATSAIIHSIIYTFRPKINEKISFIISIAQLLFFGVLDLLIP